MSKIYAVKKGYQTGIFYDWPTVQQATNGYSNAQYQGFKTIAEAQSYLNTPDTTDDYQRTDQTIILYTDGGCRNHGNRKNDHVHADDPAGWAFYVEQAHQALTEHSGSAWGHTNNYMETTAVIHGFQWLIDHHLTQQPILLISDSKYVIETLQNQRLTKWQAQNWRQNTNHPVKNIPLWQTIAPQLAQFKELHYHWVKGHAVDHGNIKVDTLVNQAMDELTN